MVIVGRPQPKELSQRIVIWLKIVGWEFGKVIVNFINCFVIRQVKVSFIVIKGIIVIIVND